MYLMSDAEHYDVNPPIRKGGGEVPLLWWGNVPRDTTAHQQEGLCARVSPPTPPRFYPLPKHRFLGGEMWWAYIMMLCIWCETRACAACPFSRCCLIWGNFSHLWLVIRAPERLDIHGVTSVFGAVYMNRTLWISLVIDIIHFLKYTVTGRCVD